MQLFDVLTAATTDAQEIAVNCLRLVDRPRRPSLSLAPLASYLLLFWVRCVCVCDGPVLCFQCDHTHRLQMSRGGPGALLALFCQGISDD